MKIYCKDCEYFIQEVTTRTKGTHCNKVIGYEDRADDRYDKYGSYKELNENNDCKYFKRIED